MDFPTLTTLVRDVGLPAAMLFWFMYRTDRAIKENTLALTTLRDAVLAHVSQARRGTSGGRGEWGQ